MDFLTAPLLTNLTHGFFTRKGGISEGIYASLNCGYGSGDALDKVSENRARIESALKAGSGSLSTQRQVHGVKVTHLTKPLTWDEGEEADAMVTDRPGILLGILTADCAPILLADAECGVIGAAHAGWKGAIGNIAGETVKAMIGLGARPGRITAAIGPCIGQASYEVDAAFEARFMAADKANTRFFIPSDKPLHFRFDLRGYVALTLANAGIQQVNMLANDTCFEEDDFFSYRRTTLRGENAYGRQLSVIMLT